MRWISLRAVLLGMAATLGIDLLTGLAALMLWPSTATDAAGRVAELHAQPAYMAFALVAGTLSTVVGGGVCALKAPALPYWNVFAFGVVGLVVGALLSSPEQPVWFSVLAFLTTVPAGLVGAKLALQRR